MLSIGIIGKGYLGESINHYNCLQKTKNNISFFSPSKFFLNKKSYSVKNSLLKKNQLEIAKKFNEFLSNKKILINTFTIQYDEFLNHDEKNRKLIFKFYSFYIDLFVKEIQKFKLQCIHISTKKTNNSYFESDPNYWYVKCHKYLENKFQATDLEIKIIYVPNIFGQIKNTTKGRKLLINSIIDSSKNKKKFQFVNKNAFYRDILYIEVLCRLFYEKSILKIDKNKRVSFNFKKAQSVIDKNTFSVEVHNFSEIIYNFYNNSDNFYLNYCSKKKLTLDKNDITEKVYNLLLKKFI